MSYLGAIPRVGTYIKLDDISSLFDGTTTEFQLAQSGTPVSIPSTRQMNIVLNGVMQEPGVAFMVGSDSTKIQFAEAPPIGSVFWGTIFGESYDTVTVGDGTVTSVKLDDGAVSSNKIANGAVVNSKIPDGEITGAKLANLTVTNTKIADNSVTLQKIQDQAVTFPKVANSAIASQAEAEAGTASDKLMTSQRTKQAITGAIKTSPQLALANQSEITHTHNESSIPHMFGWYLVCVTPEHGYVAGDRVVPNNDRERTDNPTSQTNFGSDLRVDATEFTIRTAGGGIATIIDQTGTWRLATTANWEAVIWWIS